MDMDITVGKQWPALAGFGACYSIRKFSEISGKHCSFATMVKEGVLKDVGEEYAKTQCNRVQCVQRFRDLCGCTRLL